jgi:alkanesulfonate monooxygenase SsuD/methylene tetrahydromethanopterin reductase-like flavin-dependent oxidoreductase (luciferase family)
MWKNYNYIFLREIKGRVRAIPGEGLDIPIWILGSSTESAYLAAAKGCLMFFASHFAPAQLLNAIKIEIIFNLQTVKRALCRCMCQCNCSRF